MYMKPTEVISVKEEGLLALLGQKVLIMCSNYFYYGELVGVNDTCIKLKEVYQIFETGAFTDAKFKDAQKMAEEWYVNTNAIESFGKSFKSL